MPRALRPAGQKRPGGGSRARLGESLRAHQEPYPMGSWKSEPFLDRRRVRIFCFLRKREQRLFHDSCVSKTLSERPYHEGHNYKSAVRQKGHNYEVRCKQGLPDRTPVPYVRWLHRGKVKCLWTFLFVQTHTPLIIPLPRCWLESRYHVRTAHEIFKVRFQKRKIPPTQYRRRILSGWNGGKMIGYVAGR